MLKLMTSVSLESYDSLKLRRPRVLGGEVSQLFMCDTGASISIAGMQFAGKLGIREDDLLKVDMTVSSADNSPITVMGAVLVDIMVGTSRTREMIYICRGTAGCLLSLNGCINLGIIPGSFPTPGCHAGHTDQREVGSTTVERARVAEEGN